jgi:hypothetical protein
MMARVTDAPNAAKRGLEWLPAKCTMRLPKKGDSMKVRVALMVGFGVFVSSAAVAEPPIGSRLGERVERNTEKRDREAAIGAQEMARCLVNKQTRTARAYLATVDAAEGKRLSHQMDGEHECFSMTDGNDLVEGRMVMFPEDIFRGMLAEWMIKKDPASFAALTPLPRQLTYSRPWYVVSYRDASVDEMATCVAETNPAAILRLINTEPYSDQEGATFGAIVPDLGTCLRAGVKLTGNRQSLRAALADALYQRIANPVPMPAAAPH